MKKILLVLAAVSSFATAFARDVIVEKAASQEANLKLTNVVVRDGQPVFAAPMKSPENSLWYKRPAGSLCPSLSGYLTTQNSGWVRVSNAVNFFPAQSTVELVNASSSPASTQWNFTARKKGKAIDFKNVEVKNGNAYVTTFGCGAYPVPQLEGAAGTYYWGEEAPGADNYASMVGVDSLYDVGFEEIPLDVTVFQGSGGQYYVGTRVDRVDFNGDGAAEAVWQDGFHMFYPKPLAPLSFSRIDIPVTSYSGEFFSGEGKLTFTIYKVKSTPAGGKTFGDVIYTTQLDASNFAQEPGILIMGKQAHLLMYMNPDKQSFITIDEEFAVELKGFQQPGVDIGTRTVIRFASAKANPEAVPVLYRDFQDRNGNFVGSVIYGNNDMGVPISFYGGYDVVRIESENSDIQVSADGASCSSSVRMATSASWVSKAGAELYKLVDAPEWVKGVNAQKVEQSLYDLTVVCDPLPAGMESRSCQVKVKSYMAAESDVITITQTAAGPALLGDVNGDGEVNVSDVTALINRILGTASFDDSVCDINGDGVVNVSDVTALINNILGE